MTNETILIGQGSEMSRLSSSDWEVEVRKAPDICRERLAFMSADHHRVRYFVVQELTRAGRPIPPESIAERLGLTLVAVNSILDDLEPRFFFLVRNPRREVSWAFPVTAEATPHRIIFSTGERLFGA